MADLVIDFVGERSVIDPRRVTTIGRDADIVVDGVNRFLHRKFLALSYDHSMWWIANVGATLCATIADESGALTAYLAPGAALPLVFPRTTIWFSAGSTTYEFDVLVDQPAYEPACVMVDAEGQRTIGRVSFTPDQLLMVLALCEEALRRGNRAPSAIPTNIMAAKRLGWSVTKFNRKLDNVCDKLSQRGVRGLRGDLEQMATSRKSRLVEYALAARVVTPEDLELLDKLEA